MHFLIANLSSFPLLLDVFSGLGKLGGRLLGLLQSPLLSITSSSIHNIIGQEIGILQSPLLSVTSLVRNLTSSMRGLTSSQQPVVKLVKSFVEPCSITNPILMGKGLDDDVDIIVHMVTNVFIG